MVLCHDLWARINTTCRRAQFSRSASHHINASLAAASTGGAETLIRNSLSPPLCGTIPPADARDRSFTESKAPPEVSRRKAGDAMTTEVKLIPLPSSNHFAGGQKMA
jgi:hypothetical protein